MAFRPYTRSLAASLNSLREEDWYAYFGTTIVDRGLAYYDGGAVGPLTVRPGRVYATVFGTQPYTTELRREEKSLVFACSCPYGGRCKHEVALLYKLTEAETLAALGEFDEAEGEQERAYLATLSRAEVEELVIRFAPDSFWTQRRFVRRAARDISGAWEEVERDLSNLLGVRHEGGGEEFEEELEPMLAAVSALHDSDVDRTLAWYRQLYDGIDEKKDEGELYNYRSDAYFDGDVIWENLLAWFKATDEDTALRVYQFLDERQRAYSYAFIEGWVRPFVTAATEQPHERVLAYLTDPDYFGGLYGRQQALLGELLLDELPSTDQLVLLEAADPNDPDLQLRYLRLLHEQRGFEALQRAVTTRFDEIRAYHKERRIRSFYRWEPVYRYYVDALFGHTETAELRETAVRQYLDQFPGAKSLTQAVAWLPARAKDWERIVQEKAPASYADYLENAGRYLEAHRVYADNPVKLNPYGMHSVRDFYYRRAAELSEAAEPVLKALLSKQLEYADTKMYPQVVRTLRALAAILPAHEFSHLVDSIRNTYERRRSLLRALREAGW